ncbi:hypothetical protein [Gloeobacter morelensis]|nr:hypothetical protein [Gloeobacter morelensis]UFP97283.1 hypothetical protein ISF26_24490 [Gloeobacter morelensis MG652769]
MASYTAPKHLPGTFAAVIRWYLERDEWIHTDGVADGPYCHWPLVCPF